MTEHPEDFPPTPPDSQYQDYSETAGKDLHIPGAGAIGMFLLLISLAILFIASMVAFLVLRHQITSRPPFMWPPSSLPHVPFSLWYSTAVILVASVTVQMALWAVRRDDDKRLQRYLFVTFILGLLFLVMQSINWLEFYNAFKNISYEGHEKHPYLGGFYVLTGLHAAHVIGGLIPLGFVWLRAKQGRYSRNFHPGVRYVSVYWHFLDVIWVALFLMIYF